MAEKKTRRPRRTKEDIVATIDQAAREEISQNGFLASMVTKIIKNAKIEPQVFYNRYKDINEFYEAFVRRYDGCLKDVLDNVDDPVVSEQGMASLLKEILHVINDDAVALELLRWEVCTKNKVTMRSSLMRELNFQPIVQEFIKCFKNTNIDIMGIFILLVGGVYYVSLHKKLSPFYGLDASSSEGQKQISDAIDYLINLIFEDKARIERDLEIIERLRASGVPEHVIAHAMKSTPAHKYQV